MPTCFLLAHTDDDTKSQNPLSLLFNTFFSHIDTILSKII